MLQLCLHPVNHWAPSLLNCAASFHARLNLETITLALSRDWIAAEKIVCNAGICVRHTTVVSALIHLQKMMPKEKLNLKHTLRFWVLNRAFTVWGKTDWGMPARVKLFLWKHFVEGKDWVKACMIQNMESIIMRWDLDLSPHIHRNRHRFIVVNLSLKSSSKVLYDSCLDCKFLSPQAFLPPAQLLSTGAFKASCMTAVNTFSPQTQVPLRHIFCLLFPVCSRA